MACLANNPVREPESFKILKRAGWTRISKLTPQQRRMSSFAYFERDGSIQPLPKDGSLPHGITLSELERRANPIFLPKSLFDSYVVKSDGGEFTVDRIQTLKGAEKKVAELARKYPCVGFSITSAKHGGVIKHYAASVGRGGPRVDQDNSREYKREATQAAKDSVRFRLFVNGSEYADYETKGEAEKVGKKEAGSGGKWRVKQVAANPQRLSNPSYVVWPGGRFFSSLAEAKRFAKEMSKEEHDEYYVENQYTLKTMAKYHDGRDNNPMTGVPSHDIPLELRHGRSQREAVAMALSEQRRVAENPVEVFMSERDARRFAASTLGASVIPGQSGGWVVVYPVGGRMRNPHAISDDARYHTPVISVRGVSGKRSPLSNHATVAVIRAAFPEYSNADHARAARNLLEESKRFAIAHSQLWEKAFTQTFGRKPEFHDFRISGIGNDKLPEHDKNELRELAHKGSADKIAARLHEKAAGVSAMRRNPNAEDFETVDYRGYVLMRRYDSWLPMKKTGPGGLAFLNGRDTRAVDGTKADAERLIDDVVAGKYPHLIERKRGKRNPSDEDAAVMYETFHGEPSEEVLEYHIEEFERVDWATLGDLIQLKVETSTGKLVELNAPDPERSTIEDVIKLVSSPDGKQMAFVGGDQCLDEATLKRLGFTEADIRDNMVIGLVREFTYRTQKAFDKFKTIDYYHEAGEEHPVRKVFDDFRRKPTLLYCPHDGLMKLAGGLYQVKDVGVVN